MEEEWVRDVCPVKLLDSLLGNHYSQRGIRVPGISVRELEVRDTGT